MSRQTRTILLGAIGPLVVALIIMQSLLDPRLAELRKGERTPLAGLSNEFILGPMLGVQQAIAGLLWVRADEFFHEGDYDAILPIVRMVTWLDPHQLDVYITGAWHLAYNFTDSYERSDRRYIPASQKLLEEGYENNPNVYDIAFELGWENTDKIHNYERAEYWYRKAVTLKAQDDVTGKPTKPAPMFVWHQLAHSLEREGRIDEAIGIWQQALAMSEKNLASKPNDFAARNVRDSEKHNLELTLKRKYSRYVHKIDWDVDLKQTKSVNPVTGEPTPPNAYLEYTGPNAGKPRPPALIPPWDTAFDVTKVSFPEPKVMEIKGQFNVGDGARVLVRLADEDWRQNAQLTGFTFDVDQTLTIMQDQHSVRAGKFGRRVDMSKDPKMYSFRKPWYYLVLEFDPRSTSPFIQDVFGWSGEGMKDSVGGGRYEWTQTFHDKAVPPTKILRKVYRLSLAQIMGNKPVTDADVVPNAEYDKNPQVAQ